MRLANLTNLRNNQGMATLPLYEISPAEFVSVREIDLTTSYRPDCDYVDGRVEERNVGRV